MAAVLKTVERKLRGFESCSLRQFIIQGSPKKYKNPLEIAGFLLSFVQLRVIRFIKIR